VRRSIAALELAVIDAGYLAEARPHLYWHFIARGCLVRPFGNTIYLIPPYCSTESEISTVYDAIAEIDVSA
jgi:adenosylmethionine-8-amino-7-oxononanoate aminotransferase